MKTLLPLLILSGLLAAVPARAQEGPSPGEVRMREQLKSVMLQLREAQGQLAAAQAELAAKTAEADGRIAALTARAEAQSKQLEALARQSIADRETAAETIATLNGSVEKQSAQIARMNETLGKWKVAYQQVMTVARDKDQARAALDIRCAELQLKLADRERKNIDLYKLGGEILDRYEKFGLGDALTAREPFVGTTRVKFQTLIQDYKDRLFDDLILEKERTQALVPPGFDPLAGSTVTTQP